MSVITHDQLKECFDAVTPLNGYLVAEITDKPSERVLASGLVVPEAAVDDNDRPFLVVRKMSEEVQKDFPTVQVGDIIEVTNGAREITYVYGPNMEKLAIVAGKYIAAVYKRIPGTILEDSPPIPVSKLMGL